MRRQAPPQHGEPLHAFVAGLDLLLVVLFRMNVDLHRQPVRQHGVDRAIEPAQKVGIEALLVTRRPLQRHRVDAQPDIVKAQFGHERNVRRIGVAIGAGRRVIAGRLGKPLRSVDAVAQMARPRKCGLLIRGAILGQNRNGKQNKESKAAHQTHIWNSGCLVSRRVNDTTIAAGAQVGRSTNGNGSRMGAVFAINIAAIIFRPRPTNDRRRPPAWSKVARRYLCGLTGTMWTRTS